MEIGRAFKCTLNYGIKSVICIGLLIVCMSAYADQNCLDIFAHGFVNTEVSKPVHFALDPLFEKVTDKKNYLGDESKYEEDLTRATMKVLAMAADGFDLVTKKIVEKNELVLMTDFKNAQNNGSDRYPQKIALYYHWNEGAQYYSLVSMRLYNPNGGPEGKGIKILEQPLTPGLDSLTESDFKVVNSFEGESKIFVNSTVNKTPIVFTPQEEVQVQQIFVPGVIKGDLADLLRSKWLHTLEFLERQEIIDAAQNDKVKSLYFKYKYRSIGDGSKAGSIKYLLKSPGRIITSSLAFAAGTIIAGYFGHLYSVKHHALQTEASAMIQQSSQVPALSANAIMNFSQLFTALSPKWEKEDPHMRARLKPVEAANRVGGFHDFFMDQAYLEKEENRNSTSQSPSSINYFIGSTDLSTLSHSASNGANFIISPQTISKKGIVTIGSYQNAEKILISYWHKMTAKGADDFMVENIIVDKNISPALYTAILKHVNDLMRVQEAQNNLTSDPNHG